MDFMLAITLLIVLIWSLGWELSVHDDVDKLGK